MSAKVLYVTESSKESGYCPYPTNASALVSSDSSLKDIAVTSADEDLKRIVRAARIEPTAVARKLF